MKNIEVKPHPLYPLYVSPTGCFPMNSDKRVKRFCPSKEEVYEDDPDVTYHADESFRVFPTGQKRRSVLKNSFVMFSDPVQDS